MGITLFLSFTACNAQIKNATTESVKVYGNCSLCESAIEEAGNVKKVAMVDWNADTRMATLIYDASKTNQGEILKRIALAGYDSDQFLAPDKVYASIPECCKYDRLKKSEQADAQTMKDHSMHSPMDSPMDNPMHNHPVTTNEPSEINQEINQLTAIFDNYFALKDVLVKSDGNSASEIAKRMLDAINSLKVDQLSDEERTIWMKVWKDLKSDTERIEETKDLGSQRNYFITLSDNMYTLLKISKQEVPVYYQHCPMANAGKGAHWLSRENEIKNPYYGSQMLGCGKTIETINQ